MLPLWQFRPYRNFVQVQRCQVQFLQIHRSLGGCVSKESAFETQAQGVKWIDVLGMVKAALCLNSEVKASSAYPHQRVIVYPGTGHCRRWKFHFYSRLDRVGQAGISTGSVALPFGK